MTPQTEPTHMPRRKMATWKIILLTASVSVAALTVLGLGGFYAIFKAVETNPPHPVKTVIDLATSIPIPPDAYTARFVGTSQLNKMIVIKKTLYGDVTSTAFIPYTGSGWFAGQPIRVVRKERVSPPPSSPLAESTEHPEIPGDTLEIRHDAIPGIVRAGFEREHLKLAPDAVLVVGRFDDN